MPRVDKDLFDSLIDDMCKALCIPWDLRRLICRIDTKEAHWNTLTWEADETYFRLSNTKVGLRRARYNEFDKTPDEWPTANDYALSPVIEPSEANFLLRKLHLDIPPMWVLVTDLGERSHRIEPVYRGSAFFKTQDIGAHIFARFKSEKAFNTAWNYIVEHKGENSVEFEGFCRKYYNAALMLAAVDNSKGTIH